MGMSIRITAMVCGFCHSTLKAKIFGGDALAQLRETRGKCPKCRKDRFRATVTRTMSGYEPPSTSDYLLSAALTTRGPHGHTVVWDDIFELSEMGSEELLANLSKSPEAVSDWITALRKEDAKAHLRPDQGLCRTCGEIFTVALAGHTKEGFCSPLCKRKGTAGPDAPAATPAGSDKVAPCANCGKPVRRKPGARCLHCGAKAEA